MYEIKQTVEIPINHRLYIDVPPEVPTGKTILTFTPASLYNDIKSAKEIWITNKANPEEVKTKLNNLRGSLGKNAFGSMDGVTYQRKVREDWDN